MMLLLKLHMQEYVGQICILLSWCSTCEFCVSGNTHCCMNGGVNSATGVYRNGGWSEFCRVSAEQVFQLSSGVSLKQGVLCEPMSCIMRGWERVSPIHVGNEVLITGSGIIGNLWCSLLHHQGHKKVTVCESSETRKRLNAKLETNFECVTPLELAKIKENGWSAHVAIDCSGNGSAISQALDVLKPMGKLCIFGVTSPEVKITISPYEIFKRELTIIGSLLNPFTFKKAIEIIEAMGTRYFDYTKLGIVEFEIKNYKVAIEKLKQREVAKAVFTIKPENKF